MNMVWCKRLGGWVVVWALAACGETAGAGGSGAETEGGSSGDGGSSNDGGAGGGGAGPATGGGGSVGDGGGGAVGGGGAGGGGPFEHCNDAVNCSGVQGYFCYEVSAPGSELEAACANELGGTFGAGPCDAFYDTSACIQDCSTPSEYSFGVTVDQAACEEAGGTYLTP